MLKIKMKFFKVNTKMRTKSAPDADQGHKYYVSMPHRYICRTFYSEKASHMLKKTHKPWFDYRKSRKYNNAWSMTLNNAIYRQRTIFCQTTERETMWVVFYQGWVAIVA